MSDPSSPPPPASGGASPAAPVDFRRAEEIYFEVASVSPADQPARIAQLCEGNDALRRAVLALLDAASRVGGFLEEPALGRAFDDLRRESERSADERDELLGAVLGPFQLEKRIASGGMGTVYRAVRIDAQFQQRVAIKVVKRGMDTEEILRRFKEERETLAQLDHPAIVRLLDAGVTPDGRPYLVMEHVEGLPIDEFCNQRRLSLNDRLRLMRLVCEGVHAAHRALVVHRDLKPSNILVTESGSPKLLDFGIAKVFNPESAEAAQTVEHERRLTPEYASPEQVKGDPITTASDVYSLGVILYELLTGTRPYAFALRSREEVRRVVVGAVPALPSEAVAGRSHRRSGTAGTPSSAQHAAAPASAGAPGTSPHPPTGEPGSTPLDHARTHRVSSTRLRSRLRGDLDTIVMMALRKEPARRYASAEQMGADIGRYLAGMPVTARRDTLAYRARKFVRRHTAAVAAAACAVALLIGALMLRTQQRNEIQRQRDALLIANKRLVETRGVLIGILSGAQTSAKGPAATLGESLQDAAVWLETNPPEDELTRAGVSEAVGSSMMTLGMTSKARPLLEAAFERFKHEPADSDARMAVEADLAQLLYYEGKYAEAEGPLRELLARERARNRGAPTALEGDLLNALGAVLRLTSRFDEALLTQQQALTVRTSLYGSSGLPVAESLNNIASIHLSAGRFDQAVDGFKRAMAIREKRLRDGHPMLLSTAANLGLALSRNGEHQNAIPMLRRAADGWGAAFGDAHPGQVTVLTSLGQALRAEGRTADALEVFRRALEWQSKHVDAGSPAVLATRANIGITLARSQPPAAGCDEAIRTLDEVRSSPVFAKLSAELSRQSLEALVLAYDNCGRAEEARRVRDQLPPKSPATPAR